jgi:DNA-binding Xre family transcriptional regulator
MISYDKLWDTMRRKGITQYRLINEHKVSPGQIGRLKKNMHCSTHTLERLCKILDCNIGDIVEYKS